MPVKDRRLYFLLSLLSLGVVFGIVLTPVMTDHLLVSQDGLFHLGRLQSLADALAAGIFPVKVHPSLFYTYGYGSGFFYPNLFLYLPAFLMRMGVSLELAYHCYVVLMMGVAFLAAFFSVRALGAPSLAGLITGLCLICNSFYLREVYDGSIGTYTAMGLFLPAICGVLCIMEKRPYGKRLLCLGLIGVLQSHSISFVLLMITLFLLCVISLRAIVSRAAILRDIFLCGIASALLSASYLLPAFEQVAHQRFRGQTELQSIPLYDKTLSPAQLLQRLGPAAVVLFLVSVALTVWLRKKTKMSQNIRILLLILILSFITCFPPFWKITYPVLKFVQYPHRVLSMVSVLIALFTGLTVSALLSCFPKRLPSAALQTALLLLFAAAVALMGRGTSLPDHYSSARVPLIFTMDEINDAVARTGREWHPVEAYNVPTQDVEASRAADGSGADGIKHLQGAFYEVWFWMDLESYTVPYTYYYGYTASLLDDAGNAVLALTCEKGDNGQVRVLLPDGASGVGHVIVRYQRTLLQTVGYFLSLFSYLAGLVLFFVRLRKRRHAFAVR